MNTVCKEHEWVGYLVTSSSGLTHAGVQCKHCGWQHPDTKYLTAGTTKPPLDIIEDEFLKWDKIWEEWEGVLAKWKVTKASDMQFFEWIEQNYIPPIKK